MYQSLVEESEWPLEPMLDLVRFLAGSRYAPALFPSTSHTTLLVGRAPNFDADDGELQIGFDGAMQKFKFTYVKAANELNPWSRECGPTEWPHVLERVLHKRLQWFHEG
jgi:hypothetical protein